jgi:hypothetical protein
VYEQLLHERSLFVLLEQERPHELVTGRDHVAMRMRPHLLVLLEQKFDPCEAVRVAALAQERDRKPPLKLSRLLGNPLVCAPEDFFGLQELAPFV